MSTVSSKDLTKEDLVKHINKLCEALEDAHSLIKTQRKLISKIDNAEVINALSDSNTTLVNDNDRLQKELQDVKLELQKEKTAHDKTDELLYNYEQDYKKLQKANNYALSEAAEFKKEKDEALLHAKSQKSLADAAFKKLGACMKQRTIQKREPNPVKVHIDKIEVNNYYDGTQPKTTTVVFDENGHYRPANS